MGVIARALFLTATAAVCAAALFRWVWVPHRCSIEVTALTRHTNLALDTANDYGRTVRARRNLEQLAAMREHCSTDVRVPMLVAANERLLGNYEGAIRSYQAALQVERRPEIYTALAETLIVTGRLDDAVASYAEAVRFGSEEVIPSPGIRELVQERLDARRP